MSTPFFSEQTFKFLEQLAKNNNRPWFNEHKPVYEQTVRSPALNFIESMQPVIKKLSPNFTAVSTASDPTAASAARGRAMPR